MGYQFNPISGTFDIAGSAAPAPAEHDYGTSGVSKTLDWSLTGSAPVIAAKLTLTGNCTLTMSGALIGQRLLVRVVQGSGS